MHRHFCIFRRALFLSISLSCFQCKTHIKHRANTRVHKYNASISQVNKSVAPQQTRTHTHAQPNKYKQTHFQWFVLCFSYCCCVCSLFRTRSLARSFAVVVFNKNFRFQNGGRHARIQRNRLTHFGYISAQHTNNAHTLTTHDSTNRTNHIQNIT